MPLRAVMEDVMAQAIEFHIPDFFPRKSQTDCAECEKSAFSFAYLIEKGMRWSLHEPASRDSRRKQQAKTTWSFGS